MIFDPTMWGKNGTLSQKQGDKIELSIELKMNQMENCESQKISFCNG